MQKQLLNLAEIDLSTLRPGRLPPLLRQMGFGVVCAFGFIAARVGVDQLAPTAGPFALIYISVLIATLFGRWQAGVVCYILTMSWTWTILLPRAAALRLARPADGPRTLVNALAILTVLIFAEVFRGAVRRAAAQRDAALADMADRETELRELNATLEKRVQERSARLMQTEEALRQSQKLEAIGQLTGGVAHDFNNLLTVIKGSVELLNRAKLPDGKHMRYIAAIGDTADRAAKLTSQLLAFARRQTLRPETIDVGLCAREIGGIIRSLIGARMELDVQIPDDALFVKADRSQFDTAVVNLAVNARDAMNGEGSLTISVTPADGMPSIRSHEAVCGDFVALTVTDSGTGIDPDSLEHIFEPFYTTKPVGEGTGLGLSQVFGFAKQSMGDVQVRSEAGSGASFTIYLPRVRTGSFGSGCAEQLRPAVDGDGLCVLLVEDNPAVAEFAAAALMELGLRYCFGLRRAAGT